jgi:hypothetical protein
MLTRTTNVAFEGASTPGTATNIWTNNISFGGAPPYGWGPIGNIMLAPDASLAGGWAAQSS